MQAAKPTASKNSRIVMVFSVLLCVQLYASRRACQGFSQEIY